MKPSCIFLSLTFAVLVSLTAGCLGWEPGWKEAQAPASGGNVNALLDKAKRLVNEADSMEKVQQVIGVYEEALKADPKNITALNSLGMYYFLMAYCYMETGKDKKPYYLKALQYNERAMYANPEFKALADRGEPVWDACRALGKNDMFAMYHWYMALGNCWTDCYSLPEKMLNFSWPARSKKVLERMSAVDTDWYAGSIHFSWAAYYTVLPGLLGGDLEKAGRYFNRALAMGPHMTNFYVSRALYYDVKKKDRKAFVEDLHHALAIDPRNADLLSYPWAVWFQKRAIQLLKDIDRYFK